MLCHHQTETVIANSILKRLHWSHRVYRFSSNESDKPAFAKLYHFSLLMRIPLKRDLLDPWTSMCVVASGIPTRRQWANLVNMLHSKCHKKFQVKSPSFGQRGVHYPGVSKQFGVCPGASGQSLVVFEGCQKGTGLFFLLHCCGFIW